MANRGIPESDSVDKMLRQLYRLNLSSAQQEALQEQCLRRYQAFELRTRVWKRAYHSLRLFIVLGSVVLPFLVGITWPQTSWQNYYAWGVMGLSFSIATAAIIDRLVGIGDRYRHSYEFTERLNSEWWRYQQLTGPFRAYKSHADAYDLFVQRLQKLSSGSKFHLPFSHPLGDTPYAR